MEFGYIIYARTQHACMARECNVECRMHMHARCMRIKSSVDTSRDIEVGVKPIHRGRYGLVVWYRE